MSSSSSKIWIYHERQEALLCGQHALNNLVQAAVFSPQSLAEIAHQLDQMELNYMSQNNEGGVNSKDYLRRIQEGSGNVDEAGNFSIEVLRSALMHRYDISLPNIRQEGVMDGKDVTDFEGFICNKEAHWFAIRRINGRFWNLNSTLERPVVISHFSLAMEIQELQQKGYSVFSITDPLPPVCDSELGRSRGLPQYWWKESDLVAGRTSGATTAATDPWRNTGSGMRLDGQSTTAGSESSAAITEEEMLQKALAASLQEISKKVEVPPEPLATESGAARIQFRLPDGSRKVRRFRESDPVAAIYAFVEAISGQSSDNLELRYNFPPRNLIAVKNETVGGAKLNGENIQARLIS